MEQDSRSSSWCFPHLNNSCRRLQQPHSSTALLYTLLALVSLLTVALNLLVIVSISYFRQLHTPTNALLQSLAVSDLVVGLLVMPIEGVRYMEMCWLMGRLLCVLTPYVSYCLLSASLGNMVLISIDRYLAICDPLLYSSKVNLSRVRTLICLCWACSLLYNGCILIGHLSQPERYSTCHGECVVVISHTAGTIDLFVTCVGPCTIMIVLYIRVFAIAVSQARAIRLRITSTGSVVTVAKPSEKKAARTLGVVILVFLICFCPYYYPAIAGVETSNNLSYFAILSWIMLLNSCMNPLIYAMFYPWFRKAVKLIITFRIFQPQSREHTF
ncbi:trace amine-associated receptor 13c-like [Boleophthalmus pectinirostris]|uniref:trace amine-associated receptor 13c-like n=1 Tax=Boleophthalmus pectinirostris TaxID=150288 RepID=UPI00242C49E8|nr:trace amine-associated receptor 13c-like [Boleophthalmus pectinirostris]